METNKTYMSLTRELFLFREMRVIARLMNSGKGDEEIVNEVYNDNLLQYPTEKTLKNITRVCLKRLHSVDDDEIVEIISNGATGAAKQACLYAMMKRYSLVYDFMTTVIAEKYANKDLFYSKRDLNSFFTRLQEQNDDVASWSESTVSRSKSTINNILMEAEYLDSSKSNQLNYVLIDQDLKRILVKKHDYVSLAAFNCFDQEE